MNNKYNIIVDVNDIKTKQALINSKYDELCKMMKIFQKMVDDTISCYDTPSSKEYRLVAHRYLDIASLYLNNDFKEYIDKFDTIVKEYEEFYKETMVSVGRGDTNEI